MDVQNERIRWMCAAGSKEKEGEEHGKRKVRGQCQERRGWKEGHREEIEEIDGSDRGNEMSCRA